MKILHTSDWHLGRALFTRRRYEEFAAFLDWLLRLIQDEAIEVLVVAGDVFDTTTPGTRAQQLYYRFLRGLAASPCRHAVIVAGNHDSPSFLDAPKELLRAFNVHVVGSACSNPADEVLLLHGTGGTPELIVCAVPFLRDRDVRSAQPGETIQDKEQNLLDGIRNHYKQVTDAAENLRAQADRNLPIVATGHLFAAGGKTVQGDGVRELYVGSLAHVGPAIFPPALDYVALGHLHVPQIVGGSDRIRYSGAPIPMSFGEAHQQKSVVLVSFEPESTTPHIAQIPIPTFQRLERIAGDWDQIENRIKELAAEGSIAWLEVVYDANDLIGDLNDRLNTLVADTKLEILNTRNLRRTQQALEQGDTTETLDDLDSTEVFLRCLDAHQVPEAQRPELMLLYQQAVHDLWQQEAID